MAASSVLLLRPRSSMGPLSKKAGPEPTCPGRWSRTRTTGTNQPSNWPRLISWLKSHRQQPTTFTRTGKLDTAILSAQAAKNLQKQAGYVIRKNNGTTYMQFNTKLAKFKSTKLRQAVSMALDRKALAKTLGGGFTGADDLYRG